MAHEDSETVSMKMLQLRESFRSGRPVGIEWRRRQLLAMQQMVRNGKEEICQALFKDLHKSAFESWVTEGNMVESEIQHHLDHLEQWTSPEGVPTDLLNTPGKSQILREPYGVVCIMGAWNYPILLQLQPLVGAISGGNCVLIKTPSDQYTPATSRVMADLISRYLDNECIKVVEGDRSATQAVLSQRFDFIFFTGGSFVGKIVAEAAAKHLTPTILELGGKNPAIVDKSCDVELTARRLAFGCFLNFGQTCIRPDHVLVHHEIADKFIAAFKKTIDNYYGLNPQNSEWLGRIVNRRAVDRLAAVVKADAKYIIHGGQVDIGDRFIAPTLLDFGTDILAFKKSACMQDEIFGPLVPILRWSNLDWVVDYIKAEEKPLSMSCWSRTRDTCERLMKETSSGAFTVNDCMSYMTNSNLPFGGVGKSGMGAYHGKRTFEAFTHAKAVLVRPTYLDIAVRYPPFDGFKQAVVNQVIAPIPARQIKIAKWTELKQKLISFAMNYLM